MSESQKTCTGNKSDQASCYTIYLNGYPVDHTELLGRAVLMLQSVNFIGRGDLVKFAPGCGDPVIDGDGWFTYNQEAGGWEMGFKVKQSPIPVDDKNTENPPICEKGCKYMRRYDDFDLQRNAVRCETCHLVQTKRCGWNLKPGKIGGHPLDYAPCSFATV